MSLTPTTLSNGNENSQQYESRYAALDGLYSIHDELGSGGFGKVKLATHLLTGQKVAIKIIDKKSVGDDLPRVKTELEALTALSHQNICRLYQYIETEAKFYIVMELCGGGEMFDYIVRKERLEESEARYFFRQLVQAIAYVHDMGFAHRDLKPENLLLTEDLQLKLIDFGLCAHPEMGLNRPLDTCCGSPAYAAPELVQGTTYFGNEADIWSMGVLLYALLCGCLPFEDDNMQSLYMKILRGIYYEPDYLSPLSKDLLRSLLQVNPKKRITIKEIITHPWVNKKYSQTLKWKSIYDWTIVDEEITLELAKHHGKTFADMETLIKAWKFDYLTATYFIMLQQKRKGTRINLPVFRPPDKLCNPTTNLLSSPTLHSSLDKDLNRMSLESGITQKVGSSSSSKEDVDEVYSTALDDPSAIPSGSSEKRNAFNENFLKPLSPNFHDKNASYVCAMLNMPSVIAHRSPQQRIPTININSRKACSNDADYLLYDILNRPSFGSGALQKNVAADVPWWIAGLDKENCRSATVRVRRPSRFRDDDRLRIGMIYTTPVRKAPSNQCSSARVRSCSQERRSADSPTTPRSPFSNRTPRSFTKTPRLRQRVFASLERQKDRVINLLTPRKVKNSWPETLKQTKTMVNVSITSSSDPEQVRAELIRVLSQQDIAVESSGWKISGKKKDGRMRTMTFELEVVLIEIGNEQKLVGVKRKRLNGDSFMYKKVCEQVLRLAGL
ncbi:hypothetical protein AB6A40_002147 [Gnathostoma spinigerum]|uniref:non-specific serine/threonine protein kinase n=1 Tax=Gnathostoma spinigerum TaxID=75299 RepID=A0ABD6E5Z8_9BILA